RPRAPPRPHRLGPQLLDVRHDGVVENPPHRRRHPMRRSRLLPRQLDQLDNPRMFRRLTTALPLPRSDQHLPRVLRRRIRLLNHLPDQLRLLLRQVLHLDMTRRLRRILEVGDQMPDDPLVQRDRVVTRLDRRHTDRRLGVGATTEMHHIIRRNTPRRPEPPTIRRQVIPKRQTIRPFLHPAHIPPPLPTQPDNTPILTNRQPQRIPIHQPVGHRPQPKREPRPTQRRRQQLIQLCARRRRPHRRQIPPNPNPLPVLQQLKHMDRHTRDVPRQLVHRRIHPRVRQVNRPIRRITSHPTAPNHPNIPEKAGRTLPNPRRNTGIPAGLQPATQPETAPSDPSTNQRRHKQLNHHEPPPNQNKGRIEGAARRSTRRPATTRRQRPRSDPQPQAPAATASPDAPPPPSQ